MYVYSIVSVYTPSISFDPILVVYIAHIPVPDATPPSSMNFSHLLLPSVNQLFTCMSAMVDNSTLSPPACPHGAAASSASDNCEVTMTARRQLELNLQVVIAAGSGGGGGAGDQKGTGGRKWMGCASTEVALRLLSAVPCMQQG